MGFSISISSPQNAEALEDEQNGYVEEALKIKRADINHIMTQLNKRVVGMKDLKDAIKSAMLDQMRNDRTSATLVIGPACVGRHFTLEQFAIILGFKAIEKNGSIDFDKVKAHHEKSMQINVY